MKTVAAIDCGTNSIRLLITERSEDGRSLRDITRRMEIVRLGQGVDRTGQIDPEALQRTLAATERYARLCQEHQVEALRFVATSATRDARNRDQFVDGVRRRLGVDVEVISGDEEAALSYAGAVSILGETDPAPRLVVDIGGGSTELVLGDEQVRSAISLDIGSVRLTERQFHADPPTAPQVAAAAAEVHAALDRAAQTVPLEQVGTLVGVAGSITTMTAYCLGLDRYRPERINGARFSPEQMIAAAGEMLAMPRAQRSQFGFMHPGRVDVIAAGALIWREVVARVRASVMRAGGELAQTITSEHDILDGIALSVGGTTRTSPHARA